MPFKRPASPSGSRPGPSEVSTKRNKISTLKGITVYLVQAKLDAASIEELLRLAERHTSGVCSNPKDAHVIITAVGMRRRLERHMSWKVAVRLQSSFPPFALSPASFHLPYPKQNCSV